VWEGIGGLLTDGIDALNVRTDRLPFGSILSPAEIERIRYLIQSAKMVCEENRPSVTATASTANARRVAFNMEMN
jgi:hypothetical protein